MHKVFAIFDRKMKEYQQVMYARNELTVMRGVADVLTKGAGLMSDHPADFDLFEIGAFDVDTGELEGITPRLIVNLQDLMEAE